MTLNLKVQLSKFRKFSKANHQFLHLLIIFESSSQRTHLKIFLTFLQFFTEKLPLESFYFSYHRIKTCCRIFFVAIFTSHASDQTDIEYKESMKKKLVIKEILGIFTFCHGVHDIFIQPEFAYNLKTKLTKSQTQLFNEVCKAASACLSTTSSRTSFSHTITMCLERKAFVLERLEIDELYKSLMKVYYSVSSETKHYQLDYEETIVLLWKSLRNHFTPCLDEL